MPIVSQKITDFPKQPDRHPPLAPIPAHLVTEDRDPAREIRNLIEKLQESTLEARRHQRKAEEECDQMRRRLAEIDNHGAPPRPDESRLQALTHERDVLLQQQNQYGPVIAELKQKLRAADAERLETIRQRDLALKEKNEAAEALAGARRNFSEAKKTLADGRKGLAPAKKDDGDPEHQLASIRQARDGMAVQVQELTRKVGALGDQAAELSYNRDAIENELNASRAQVRDLQRKMETAADSAADPARLGELEAELKDLHGKLAAAEQERDTGAQSLEAARSSLLAAQSQIEAITRDRDSGTQQLSGSMNSLNAQMSEQRAEVARLREKLSDTESRLCENEQLTRHFDKRRLDMIELATQLENAQREIRNLSASLAEARLNAKLARKKNGAGTAADAIHARPDGITTGAFPQGGPAGKDDLLALYATFEDFSRDPTQLGLLKEMESRALCLADGARDGALPVLQQVGVAFANFLGDLREVPEQISQGSFRTITQTLELIASLLADPAIEHSVNLSETHTYVVDDDAATCATVVEALDVVGLQTNFALYSSQAVAQLAGNHYDLIILDVHLPDLDGFELCSRIRSMPLHTETPVFFITGNTSLETRVQSSLRGGSEFITKPFNIPELGLRALRSVITSQLQNR